MKILAFDTCLEKMYVAIGDDDNILDSRVVETTKTTYHSAYLISTITNILKDNGLTPENIDVIAINVGPGSFTGIRACTTVARVMAQGLNKKTVGVSSLEILSKISDKNQTLVALDARKQMAYVATYQDGKQVEQPKAILVEELKEIISKNDFDIVCDNSMKPQIGGTSYQDCEDNLGEYLVKIAYEKVKSGEETDWKKLLPLYIQPPALNIKKVVK